MLASGRTAALVLFCIGLAIGKPIMKTGDCPPLTRYDAPSAEDWSQFPVKPNPASEFPVGTLQSPLSPRQSINCIEVAEGLRAELWASELDSGGVAPAPAYIQHFAFDERGRMWAVEPRSYPNTIRAATNRIDDAKFSGGMDRILILEDTDGDKVMDKVKVFRDGLNLPQSIEVVNGGVVVAMTPYLVFFPNRDDVAGTPVILFSGLGPSGNFDTNGGINSLMYGLDNWIYGHSGYNTCSVDGVHCGAGRVWRFQHTALGHARTKLEVWTTGPANAHGIGQMEDGQIFQSGANLTPHINHSIRQGARAVDIRSGTVPGNLYPITGDRFLWQGSTARNANGEFSTPNTAVAGMQFYTSRLLPRRYWNRFAFNCDGANKLCNQDSLVVSGIGSLTGSSWSAVRMPGSARSNLLASKDAWVAPLLAKTGPDGAVWVLDWYNYLFLHNPALPAGEGQAWLNHLREKKHYRIYRIAPASGATEPIPNLANAGLVELVAALDNPNLHWRLQAQRLLIARGWSAELGARLGDILKTDRTVDEVGNSPRVIHALWTLEGLGQFGSDGAAWDPVLKDLLRHPAWGVRRNVLRAMPRTAASAAAINDNCSVNDPHGHVRLQALVAFSEISARPPGIRPMFEKYLAVDAQARSAFAAAGIDSTATLPCESLLHPVGVAPSRAIALSRGDLRFVPEPRGFRLLPHGRLPSGNLRVYDSRGRMAFRSEYRAGERRWTRSEARDLAQPIYFYEFQGEEGGRIQGRLALIGTH